MKHKNIGGGGGVEVSLLKNNYFSNTTRKREAISVSLLPCWVSSPCNVTGTVPPTCGGLKLSTVHLNKSINNHGCYPSDVNFERR